MPGAPNNMEHPTATRIASRMSNLPCNIAAPNPATAITPITVPTGPSTTSSAQLTALSKGLTLPVSEKGPVCITIAPGYPLARPLQQLT